MNTMDLAKIAVTMVNVVKTNLTDTPQQVIYKILTALPTEITTNEVILAFTTYGTQIGITYEDVYDLIAQLQDEARNVASDIHWNSLMSSVANGLFAVLAGIKGLVPAPWGLVITLVLDAYNELKESF